MVNKDFFAALDDLEREKKIKKEVFVEALQTALVAAYKRDFGDAKQVEVRLLPEKCAIKVIAYKTIVEEVVDPDKEISLAEAQELKKTYKVGDIVSEEISPKDFWRVAAQTAKQVVLQRLREAEGEMAYEEVREKEEQLVTGVIRRVDQTSIIVDIGKLEAVLLPSDQCPGEKYSVNDKIKVFVKKVRQGLKGPQVLVSRSAPGFVRRLFEMEVPEIAAGIVTIKGIVREAGYRTKIAVYSDEIDAVGACVGNRGVRVNTIVAELSGEKIDVIPWCADALEFIARSLSPAKVIMVEVNDEEKAARVIVPDDKLSLAIGKRGQNARLAARLTGFKIDVKSYSDSLQREDAAAEEEFETVNIDLSDDIFSQGITELNLENADTVGITPENADISGVIPENAGTAGAGDPVTGVAENASESAAETETQKSGGDIFSSGLGDLDIEGFGGAADDGKKE
jgi:N utilization substance protein A